MGKISKCDWNDAPMTTSRQSCALLKWSVLYPSDSLNKNLLRKYYFLRFICEIEKPDESSVKTSQMGYDGYW